MKIAYLTSQYPAASHTFIRREVEELRRREINIQTFSVRKPSATELTGRADGRESKETSYILAAGVPAFVAAGLLAFATSPRRFLSVLALAFRHRPPGLRGAAYALIYFGEAMLFARWLQRAEVGRLHCHFANAAAIVGMLAAKYLELPFSLTLHGVSEFDYPAGLLLREKIEFADFVACASWFVRAQAMRLTDPSQWTKLHIVRCGLDLSRFEPGMMSGRTGGAPHNIVCVGRLSAEKGHFGLLEALDSMRDLDLRISFVGDGPYREALEEEVGRLELADRIEFMGTLSEDATKAVIASSDLLVLPSFMEGLPVVLMEAMALGIPVVAPRVSGIPELVEDRAEGFLFRPSDWADLREKLRFALGHGDIGMICRQARSKIEREFDIRGAVDLLSPLLAGTRTDPPPPQGA